LYVFHKSHMIYTTINMEMASHVRDQLWSFARDQFLVHYYKWTTKPFY